MEPVIPKLKRTRLFAQLTDEAIAGSWDALIAGQKEQPRTERDWKTLRREFIGSFRLQPE